MNENRASVWIALVQVLGLIVLLTALFRGVWTRPDHSVRALPDVIQAPIGGDVAP